MCRKCMPCACNAARLPITPTESERKPKPCYWEKKSITNPVAEHVITPTQHQSLQQICLQLRDQDRVQGLYFRTESMDQITIFIDQKLLKVPSDITREIRVFYRSQVLEQR